MSQANTPAAPAGTAPRFINDVMFKRIFTDPVVLCGLINGLLGYEGDERVIKVTFMPTDPPPDHHGGKSLILDLRAIDQIGRQFNVEVQKGRHGDIVRRSFLYATGMLHSQNKAGGQGTKLRPSISIVITDVNLFPHRKEVHTPTAMRPPNDNIITCRDVECHFFELGKMKSDDPATCTTELLMWLHMLQYGERYCQGRTPLPQAFAAVKEIPMTVKHYNDALIDDAVRFAAYMREWDERELERCIAEERAAGTAEGEAKGRAKGESKGRAEGRAEGERQKTLDMARKLRDLGTDVSIIAAASGLTPDEINQL